MIHFHCRKCATNILTEDGKVKPTFTDGLCPACNSVNLAKEIAAKKEEIAKLETKLTEEVVAEEVKKEVVKKPRKKRKK